MTCYEAAKRLQAKKNAYRRDERDCFNTAISAFEHGNEILVTKFVNSEDFELLKGYVARATIVDIREQQYLYDLLLFGEATLMKPTKNPQRLEARRMLYDQIVILMKRTFRALLRNFVSGGDSLDDRFGKVDYNLLDELKKKVAVEVIDVDSYYEVKEEECFKHELRAMFDGVEDAHANAFADADENSVLMNDEVFVENSEKEWWEIGDDEDEHFS